MRTARATLHMALACYLSPNPDKQIVYMAQKYKRMTRNSRTAKTMKIIIEHPTPAALVRKVYAESLEGKPLKEAA